MVNQFGGDDETRAKAIADAERELSEVKRRLAQYQQLQQRVVQLQGFIALGKTLLGEEIPEKMAESSAESDKEHTQGSLGVPLQGMDMAETKEDIHDNASLQKVRRGQSLQACILEVVTTAKQPITRLEMQPEVDRRMGRHISKNSILGRLSALAKGGLITKTERGRYTAVQ